MKMYPCNILKAFDFPIGLKENLWEEDNILVSMQFHF